MSTLISMQEYQRVLGMKCDFNGHVWDTDGSLLRVSTIYDSLISTSPDRPYERHQGYGKNDKFHTSTRKTTITLEEIEGDDLVYDEDGNYVCVKPDNNSVKGEIFIRKQLHKYPMGVFEDIPLKGSRYDLSLTPEAYSKIFTHILSLDNGIKTNLSRIRKGEISIQYHSENDTQFYNMTGEEKRHWDDAYAFADQKKDAGIIVAIIEHGSARDMYATLWNVMSLLGVHEMGHILHPWWTTPNRTHHLNYVYQMGHDSWKHTTGFFQRTEYRSMEGYYKDSERYFDENPDYQDRRERYRKYDFYPKDGEKLDDFVNRTKYSIQNYWSVRERSPFKSTYGKKK